MTDQRGPSTLHLVRDGQVEEVHRLDALAFDFSGDPEEQVRQIGRSLSPFAREKCDLFVLFSEIRMDGYRVLEEGQRVTYDVGGRQGRFRLATNVRAVRE